ncbi:FRG domain-containing protein [Vibrio cholerae]|nr:FRG domain-containing protein [Vibrio cholerae]
MQSSIFRRGTTGMTSRTGRKLVLLARPAVLTNLSNFYSGVRMKNSDNQESILSEDSIDSEATDSAVVSDAVIRSVAELMQRIRAGRQSEAPFWYRGQSNARWPLMPKLARNKGFLANELSMLKHFKQDAAPRLRDRPTSPWEWIFLAQHYGLPTRLLDWSENPLVGAFFAVENDNADMDSPVNGALYELNPDRLNAETTGDSKGDVIMFDQDVHLEHYLPSEGFVGRLGPMAAIASRSFDRIVAQSGTFTITHKDHEIATVDNPAVTKIMIPAAEKPFFREDLADLGIRPSTVYPDLAHLAEHVMERHSK